MSLIRDTYLRFQVLVHEVGRFVVIGGMGAVVQLVVQSLLYPKHTGALTSEVVGTVIATIFTYLGSKYWTFKHREGKSDGHERVLFVVFNVLGLLVQAGIFELIFWASGGHGRTMYYVATVIGIGIATLFRFVCYRKFVFRQLKPDASSAEELQPANR